MSKHHLHARDGAALNRRLQDTLPINARPQAKWRGERSALKLAQQTQSPLPYIISFLCNYRSVCACKITQCAINQLLPQQTYSSHDSPACLMNPQEGRAGEAKFTPSHCVLVSPSSQTTCPSHTVRENHRPQSFRD